MPINPEIALQVKPVQVADPMQAYGNALQMRSHIQQQELQRKQMEAIDLENQARKHALDAEQGFAASIPGYISGLPGTQPRAATPPPNAASPATPQQVPPPQQSAPNALTPPATAPPDGSTEPAPVEAASGGTLDPNAPANVRGLDDAAAPNALAAMAGPNAPNDYTLKDALAPPQNQPPPAPDAYTNVDQALTPPPNQPTFAQPPAPETPVAAKPATSAPAQPQESHISIDRDALMKNAAKNGWLPQFYKWDTDQRAMHTAELANQKTALDNTQSVNQQLGSALDYVNKQPDAKKAAAYDIVYTNLVRDGLVKKGQIPEAYDPEFVALQTARAQSLDKLIDNRRQALELERKLFADSAKPTKEWLNLVGQAKDGSELQRLAATAKSAGAPPEVLNLIPREFTPEGMKTLRDYGETEEQQITGDEKIRANDAAVLGASRTYGDFQKSLIKLPPPRRDAFSSFDFAGKQAGDKITPEDAKAIEAMGLTAEQKTRADETRALHVQNEAHQKALEGIGWANANVNQQRADQAHTTGKQHDTFILGLAGEALRDSNKNGGGGIDDAIRNVANTDNYEKTETGDNRIEVLKALNAVKAAQQVGAKRQADLDAKTVPNPQERMAYVAAHKGATILDSIAGKYDTAIIAARKGGTPAPAKPVTPPPAVTPPLRKRVNGPNGQIDVELRNNVWVNAATGKPLGQ